jgi:septum formation protein
MTQLILASGSPRRHDLLEALGVIFDVVQPDVDETPLTTETPEAYVQRLSHLKATTVAATLNGTAYILAADTTVIHNGEILGKPEDEDDARRMLLRLRGDTHQVCTGFTVLHIVDGEISGEITDLTCTEVTMRFYAASEMERWIMSGAALDKAGAYAIQSNTFDAVADIDGSYNNVVGLPTLAVESALRRLGFDEFEERSEDEG